MVSCSPAGGPCKSTGCAARRALSATTNRAQQGSRFPALRFLVNPAPPILRLSNYYAAERANAQVKAGGGQADGGMRGADGKRLIRLSAATRRTRHVENS